MTESYLDGLFEELVATDPHPAWSDVVRRARRSRRRYVAAIALVGALVLVPAAWAVADAFKGSPAPKSIQLSFRRLNSDMARATRALAKKFPRANAKKARGVLQLRTNDGPLDLWAAPATGGGTCWFVGWESDLNAPHGPLGSTSCVQPKSLSDKISSTWERDIPNHPRYSVVSGFVSHDATTVKMKLRDGRSATLPVVEHLFMAAFRDHDTVITLTARNASGKIVGSWRLPGT